MKNFATTHIEVVAANKGAEIFGLQDGHLIKVEKETENFFFCVSHSGKQIKVSKQTKRACSWRDQKTSPVFNV